MLAEVVVPFRFAEPPLLLMLEGAVHSCMEVPLPLLLLLYNAALLGYEMRWLAASAADGARWGQAAQTLSGWSSFLCLLYQTRSVLFDGK